MANHLTRRPEKALTAQAVKAAIMPGKYFDGHGLYYESVGTARASGFSASPFAARGAN